jgi:GNAT superfamily N-acetyltransferase
MVRMTPAIRPASLQDADTIASFNAAMAWETEHRKLDPDRLRSGVLNLLTDPGRGFYLIAEVGGRIAGQLMITYEWSDWRNGNFWWIQSVYVAEEFRGRGVFSGLYEEVHRLAKESGESCGLRLYVERENVRAKRTYEKLGMRPAVYDFYEVDFVMGDGG